MKIDDTMIFVPLMFPRFDDTSQALPLMCFNQKISIEIDLGPLSLEFDLGPPSLEFLCIMFIRQNKSIYDVTTLPLDLQEKINEN